MSKKKDAFIRSFFERSFGEQTGMYIALIIRKKETLSVYIQRRLPSVGTGQRSHWKVVELTGSW